MNLQTAFAAVALTVATFAAQAAPQATVKLERVVVTGKSTQIAQLPRVVVIGYSEATLARQTLAAAKSPVKRA
ncbi:hypothetical protein [Roseateles sp.]|uniref:hypothetical protein n=1 Tax=Roseateles sp. TaxID=1971397 RepID=UPI003BAD817A